MSRIFTVDFFNLPEVVTLDFIIIIIIFLIIEWISREKFHPLYYKVNNKKIWLRIIQLSFISILIWSILLWGAFDNKEFIYFQF